jgi:hypothetical protein
MYQCGEKSYSLANQPLTMASEQNECNGFTDCLNNYIRLYPS